MTRPQPWLVLIADLKASRALAEADRRRVDRNGTPPQAVPGPFQAQAVAPNASGALW